MACLLTARLLQIDDGSCYNDVRVLCYGCGALQRL